MTAPLSSLPLNRTAALQGMSWQIAAGLFFVGYIVSVKFLGPGIPAQQGAFVRFALAALLLLPVLLRAGASWPRGRDARALGLRGLVHSVAVVAWFFAMARLPVAEVTAINYLVPIYLTLGGALIFREPIGRYRIAAVLVGFGGMVILLRPGFREIGPGHLAMLVTSAGLAASYLMAKALSARFSAELLVFWMTALVALILGPLAWQAWVPLGARDWGLLSVAACLSSAGHYAITRALAAAPVAVVQPVTFLQLIWSALAGLVLFGEPLDPYVILGGAVIVASVSFIAWRELVLKKT